MYLADNDWKKPTCCVPNTKCPIPFAWEIRMLTHSGANMQRESQRCNRHVDTHHHTHTSLSVSCGQPSKHSQAFVQPMESVDSIHRCQSHLVVSCSSRRTFMTAAQRRSIRELHDARQLAPFSHIACGRGHPGVDCSVM